MGGEKSEKKDYFDSYHIIVGAAFSIIHYSNIPSVVANETQARICRIYLRTH